MSMLENVIGVFAAFFLCYRLYQDVAAGLHCVGCSVLWYPSHLKMAHGSVQSCCHFCSWPSSGLLERILTHPLSASHTSLQPRCWGEQGLSFRSILQDAKWLRSTWGQDIFLQSVFPQFILEWCGCELVHVPSKAVPMSQGCLDFG